MLSGNITHKRSGSPHGCFSEQLSLSLAPLPADTSNGKNIDCPTIPLNTLLYVTEARMFTRDWDRGVRGAGRESEGSTARTDPEDRGGR